MPVVEVKYACGHTKNQDIRPSKEALAIAAELGKSKDGYIAEQVDALRFSDCPSCFKTAKRGALKAVKSK